MKKFITAFALLLLSMASTVMAVDNNDPRQLVELPAMMRQHMLGNMRDHLLAISEIQQALAEGHFEKAGDIAERRIGVSSLTSHGAGHMAPFMPRAMQELGTEMHKAASRFAVIAQESGVEGDARRAVGALSAVTQQCVACHSAFRIH